MPSQNKVILVGVVEEGPDIKATNAGDTVTRFKLCVERPQRQDGMQSGQDSIPIVAWQKVAESASQINQGDRVLVEGQVQTRNYDDPNGFKIYVTEVNARELKKMSESKKSDQYESATSQDESEPSKEIVNVSEKTPVLETVKPKTESKADDIAFEFNDHSNKEIIENAPSFDKPIEDDVPF